MKVAEKGKEGKAAEKGKEGKAAEKGKEGKAAEEGEGEGGCGGGRRRGRLWRREKEREAAEKGKGKCVRGPVARVASGNNHCQSGACSTFMAQIAMSVYPSSCRSSLPYLSCLLTKHEFVLFARQARAVEVFGGREKAP